MKSFIARLLGKRPKHPDGHEDEASAESPPPGTESQPAADLTETFPDGVKVLHDCKASTGKDAVVDICFVHGLTGNRTSTWTAHGQPRPEPWPKTLIPPKLNNCRILTYGYDAYVVGRPVASKNGLKDHASNFLNDLTTNRADADASSRPIIFVAHSMGGLVCKEAILISRNPPEPHLKNVFDCVKGIVFMGTPHQGSWMADWAKLPAWGLGIVKSTNKSLLDILRTDDSFLRSIQQDFLAMVRELQKGGRVLEVACFFEELPLKKFGVTVVSKDSATFAGYNPMSIHEDHSNMVKFGSAEDNGFVRVLGELKRWTKAIEAAPVTEEPPSTERQQTRVANSVFNNHGSGSQYNSVGGTINTSTGPGHHFPGAVIHGPVTLGQPS